jgi:hypothetical protein
MPVMKNLLMGIGAVGLAAALIGLFAPHAVHAAVAALVEVSNPATSPALTSRIDDPGRIPYTNVIPCVGGGSLCSGISGNVPAKHRLVINEVSGSIELAMPGGAYCVVGLGGSSTAFLPTIATGIGNQVVLNQRVQVYVDQGQQATINCYTNPIGTVNGGFIYLNGYLLDCNAAPCAAIANF